MKNFVLFTALLAPAAAMAEVCDMTEFKKIDQRYVTTAPACIASRDYSSASCAPVKELTAEIFQASASIKAIGCEDAPYEEDPRLESLRKQVFALDNAERQAQKSEEERKAKAVSKSGHGVEVCTRLMRDIGQKYDVTDLKLLINRTDMSAFYPIMPCTYEAVRPTVYGNTRVIIEAVLNLSNNRYQIKIH